MPSIPVNVADVAIELHGPLSPAELGMDRRLGPFIGSTDQARKRVSIAWEESARIAVPRAELVYDMGPDWRMYRSEGAYHAAIWRVNGAGAAGREPLSVLRADQTWTELTLTERRGGSGWLSQINLGAGELLLRAAMAFTDGLVLHASAVDDRGRGFVFVGESGAGKSTLLGLWRGEPGAVPMNDDRIAVRAAGDGAMCYGTPWGGALNVARNHAAPVSAVLLLEKAEENGIERLAPSDVAPILVSRSFLPYWDPELVDRAMGNLDALLKRFPVYRLRFRPDPRVIPLIRSLA